MIRHLKIIAFAATLAGFAVMAGAYDFGFDRWPPQAVLADGQSVPLSAAGVQVCFKARALAVLGDHTAGDYWEACHDQLARYRRARCLQSSEPGRRWWGRARPPGAARLCSLPSRRSAFLQGHARLAAARRLGRVESLRAGLRQRVPDSRARRRVAAVDPARSRPRDTAFPDSGQRRRRQDADHAASDHRSDRPRRWPSWCSTPRAT